VDAVSVTDWTEVEPRGPQRAGDVGGDIQRGEAYSRKWWRRHPDGSDTYLTIEMTSYAAEERGRRWIQTQNRFEHRDGDYQPGEGGGVVLFEHEDISDSLHDGPAGEFDYWPNDRDIRSSLAHGVPFDWNGDYS
jgi:hypothetical protein